MSIKFLDLFTQAQIAQMCKEGRVDITITVYSRIKEEIIYPNGDDNGHPVLRLEDKILSQTGREIRSWTDLFQYDAKEDTDIKHLDKNVRESLR